MSILSNEAQGIQKRKGWQPGRCVDTTDFEKALEAKGIPVFACIREFLSQFGGLTIVRRFHGQWFSLGLDLETLGRAELDDVLFASDQLRLSLPSRRR